MEKEYMETPFLQEQIILTHRKIRRRVVRIFFRVFLYGIVAGVFASVFFVLTVKVLGMGQKTEGTVSMEENREISKKTVNAGVTQAAVVKYDDRAVKEKEAQTTASQSEKNSQKTVEEIKNQIRRVMALLSIQPWQEAGGQCHTEKRFGIAVEKKNGRIYYLFNSTQITTKEKLSIEFYNGTVCAARFDGMDLEAGIAIASVAWSDLPEVIQQMAEIIPIDETRLKKGTRLYLAGQLGGALYAVHKGRVLGKGIQHSITDYSLDIYPTNMNKTEGNSGVVLGTDGRLIGLMTAEDMDGFNEANVSFLGMSKLKKIMLRLISGESLVYCGIRAQDIPKKKQKDMEITNGIYITEVVPNSPADIADICTGDIIQKVDDREISSISDFYMEILDCGVDSRAELSTLHLYDREYVEKKRYINLEEKSQ